MNKGYVKLWRKSKISPVWQMPPLYSRVWDWVLMSVNYETKSIPTPTGPITVNPGQRITSLRQIADEVAWYEYGVLRTPNVKTIKTIIDWLESNGQCSVESNGKGTVITVINWDTYNGNGIEKVTDMEQVDETQKKQGADTNKKEPEKEPKNIENRFTKPSVNDVGEYMSVIEFNGNAEKFVNYYESKGWMIGKNKMKDWQAAVRTWKLNNKDNVPKQSEDYMTAEKVRTLTDLKMFPIDSRPNILKGLPVETVDFIMKEIRVERGVVY